MYAINIDENNRILRVTFEKFADLESILVENRPEDLVPEDASEQEKDAHNYLYINGEYIYDPLPVEPEPEPEPTADDILNALLGIGGGSNG